MRTLLFALAALVVAILVTEVTMQPTAGDRAVLGLVFSVAALMTVAGSRVLPRLTARLTSLRHTIAVLAIATVAFAGLVVVVVSLLMFLSPHDLRLALVSLGLGVVLGVLLGTAVGDPLARDLEAIADTARQVGAGDLMARTGVDRPDEVGHAAAAIDAMVGQLTEAREERDRAESARQRFMAAVGHDLRTPLTSMRAALEALQDGVAVDPERYLRSIGTDLDVVGSMVEDFFLLARIDAGKLDFDPLPVDMTELADEALEAMAPLAARRGVRLHLEAEGRVTVTGGPRELGRVLRNLLDNAIRHAPEDSVVRLHIDRCDRGAEVRVADEGPGFPPDFTPMAFEHFTRHDTARARATGGAGLGLAIARGVVEAHGGAIWVEDGPGGRVGFRIPAAAG